MFPAFTVCDTEFAQALVLVLIISFFFLVRRNFQLWGRKLPPPGAPIRIRRVEDGFSFRNVDRVLENVGWKKFITKISATGREMSNALYSPAAIKCKPARNMSDGGHITVSVSSYDEPILVSCFWGASELTFLPKNLNSGQAFFTFLKNRFAGAVAPLYKIEKFSHGSIPLKPPPGTKKFLVAAAADSEEGFAGACLAWHSLKPETVETLTTTEVTAKGEMMELSSLFGMASLLAPLEEKEEEEEEGMRQPEEETATAGEEGEAKATAEDEVDATCVICWTNRRTVALLPCKHLCCCEFCFRRLNDICPVCRTAIKAHLAFSIEQDTGECLVEMTSGLTSSEVQRIPWVR